MDGSIPRESAEVSRTKLRFEGWYYKHQSRDSTLSVIPGRAGDGAFVQVVTEQLSRCVPYPLTAYQKTAETLRIGENTFSQTGITLNLRDKEFTLSGVLQYGPMTPLKSDIMGPFRFFPMECRHGIESMRHTVSGTVTLNGGVLDFSGGTGYRESDCGRSFPQQYTWVHCNDFESGCSIMASAARIPFLGLRFQGCIAVVWLEGREIRLATYRGARVLQCGPGYLLIGQRDYRLEVKADSGGGRPLAAPAEGAMRRTILENVSCPARFRLWRKDTLLFDGESRRASYEYVP